MTEFTIVFIVTERVSNGDSVKNKTGRCRHPLDRYRKTAGSKVERKLRIRTWT